MSSSLKPVSSVEGIAPYQPGKPIEEVARELSMEPQSIVKLASNENPLGCSPFVDSVIADNASELARYPDGGGFFLKERLSEHLGITPECLILGNGSNDILELASIAFLDKGRSAVYSEFCFVVNKLATLSRGAKGIEAPSINFGHDLTAMRGAIEENTTVVFISNPNNPTGTFVSPEEVVAFLDQVPEHILVVLDEAYYEYLPAEMQSQSVELISQYDNLLITRTFSKVYGLAALRVGYGISNPRTVELMNRVRQPFNVNSLGLAAASRSLDDSAFVEASVKLNEKGMKQLIRLTDNLDLAYIPSFGNFLTIQFDEGGVEIYNQLLQSGVIVRPLVGYGMPNHLRISIGTAEENSRFCDVLTSIFAKN